MINEIKINFPNRFVFSKGSFTTLYNEIEHLQVKKIFIVTITALQKEVDEFINICVKKNIDVIIDTSIVAEPSFEDFYKVLSIAKSCNPDVVIGIGGGSVLDIAKLIAAFVDSEQQLIDCVGNGLIKNRNKTLVCVPTTSGTGSEMSPNAILVDNADGQKKGIISKYLVPDIVVVDPMLTIHLPADITAATGIDALSHCLEAYINIHAQPMADVWALEGVRLIATNLITAVNDPTNYDAREKVAMGSVYGGMCLGPVNTAAVHALSYPLGSTFHLAHGLSNAILLPYVMEYNADANIEKHAALAIAMGCNNIDDKKQLAYNGVQKMMEIIAACRLPLHLSEVGVTENDIPQLATDAMKIQRLLKNNPKEVTYEDAVLIYKTAL